MLISRNGAFDGPTVQSYINSGGVVLTEFIISDNVFSAVFSPVFEGARNDGGCSDRAPTVVQYTPADPFWVANTFTAIPLIQAGCGYDVDAFPGITPIAGWSASAVSIAYRNLGSGRLWPWISTGRMAVQTLIRSS